MAPSMAPSAPSINITTTGDREHSHSLVSINPALVAVVVAMVVSFLVVGFGTGFLKRCLRPAEDDDDPRPVRRYRPESPPPPKHRRGLDPKILDSLPSIQYNDMSERFRDSCVDCSVCLGAFNADDSLKLLPECSHAFHSDCILFWFRLHSTCPLCRACLAIPTDKAGREKREGNGEHAAIHAPEDSDVVDVVISGDLERDSSRRPASLRFPQERIGEASEANSSSKKDHPFLLRDNAGTFKPAIRVVVAHEKAAAVVAIRRSNSAGANFQLLHPSFVVDSEGTQHNKNYQTHAIDVGEFVSKYGEAQANESPSRRLLSLGQHDWLPGDLEAGTSGVTSPTSRVEPQRRWLTKWNFLNMRRP